MKIMVLSHAARLHEILSEKLTKFRLTAQCVDYDNALLPQIKDAYALVNGLGKLDGSIIDACPKLRLVHQVGTGKDNLDIDYCRLKSIYVANVPHLNNVPVAEHTLFLMMYLAKNMKIAGEGLMRGRVINVLCSELYGKNLTIIGFGATGLEVARRARCLDMNITAVTKHPDTKKVEEMDNNSSCRNNEMNFSVNRILGVQDLMDSLSDADYDSIHTPLTDETDEKVCIFDKCCCHAQ
jgi:D-3-phosphoglycerate dehydrogenase / 2-oxoglutarate reductase